MSATDLDILRQRVAELEDALATAGSKRLSFRPTRKTLDELARLPPD
jgi:hypothetical protein